ncbi:hypothetical protein Efla_007606 [Eimeria flavescens]
MQVESERSTPFPIAASSAAAAVAEMSCSDTARLFLSKSNITAHERYAAKPVTRPLCRQASACSSSNSGSNTSDRSSSSMPLLVHLFLVYLMELQMPGMLQSANEEICGLITGGEGGGPPGERGGSSGGGGPPRGV